MKLIKQTNKYNKQTNKQKKKNNIYIGRTK